jgi:hypothetical protein
MTEISNRPSGSVILPVVDRPKYITEELGSCHAPFIYRAAEYLRIVGIYFFAE